MELKPEFLGIASINQFIPNLSSPRGVMLNSHFNSHLALLTPDSRIVKSGTEFELGKFINDVKTENDCIVRAIIPRYGNSGINNIPEYLLLVEYESNGSIFIDFLSVPTYNSTHSYFGYELTPTEVMNNISIGTQLPKDTILAKTKSLMSDGSYGYGINANVALMTHPSVSEDGYVVSESFCEKMKTTSILKRNIILNKNVIPVNVYGNNEAYKMFPDIGEAVTHSGLICAIRQRNDWFNISDLNDSSLREFDPLFDVPTYVNADSVVVDIKVVKNYYHKSDYGDKITEQLDFYANLLTVFYKNIIQMYDFIMNDKKKVYSNADFIRTSPRLHRLLVDAKFRVDSEVNNKIKLCYRKMPIEQYKIEITTMNILKPNLGYKLTDVHAAKGVITKILPDAHMPVDANGTRADIISDPMSTISRMNIGRVYEGYLGATSRDCRAFLIGKVGKDVNSLSSDALAFVKQYLEGLYSIINPKQLAFFNSLNNEEMLEHIHTVLTDNLYFYYPVDNDHRITDVINNINNSIYKPCDSNVTYIDDAGNQVVTKEKVMICNFYYMLLEKIGNTYMAVSSAKVNNFGFPIKGTTLEKYKTQHAHTPTKVMGETEVRILTSYLGPKGIAEMLDLALNPTSHKLAIKHLLTKDNPGKIDSIIDRNIYQYGQNRSLLLFKHILNAAGVELNYEGSIHGE